MDPARCMDPATAPSASPAPGLKVESSNAGFAATSGALPSPRASPAAATRQSPTSLHRSPSASSVSGHSRRQSHMESLRGVHGPGHRSRQPSLTPTAVQDLLNNPPPPGKTANPKFAGREWSDIAAGELCSPEDVFWAEMDSTVEDATKLLLKSPRKAVLIRQDASTSMAISSFDYSDLNAYLLLITGFAKPDHSQVVPFNHIVSKFQQGRDVTIREIQALRCNETLVSIPSDAKLSRAIEILGGGIHRVIVTDANGAVVGILSQLKVLDFFWNERVNFPAIDRLYPTILRDLHIGTQQCISVNSDAPLSDALTLMHDEGLTSVAVVDNGQNVVGNISAKDVGHLTRSLRAPLLKASCMHFISVILNERGMERGKDAVPVFYVNPYSTLAHTVAKLVATRSHRMWVVESPSPSPSTPATPLLGPQSGSGETWPAAPVPAMSPIPASAMAGARISGKLTGVVSLTDILNVFAKLTGLHPSDPGAQRARRRRSSSSSMRPSVDSSRPSVDMRW